ncbi:MAG: hypothetical protein ACJA0F_001402 [Dinoroseobacter sp.]|jgi:hypothetical protein
MKTEATMRTVLAAAIVMLSAGTAVADCASMWVTRNLVFDRAGYCFGSNLGQSVFNNAGCTGTDVNLSAAERDFVAYTREIEAIFDCKINTARTSIDLPLLSSWLKLQDLPRRDEFESGCMGWTGPRTALRSGHSGGASVVGTLMQGDVVLLSHWAVGDWNFITVSRGEQDAAIGWTDVQFGPETCRSLAG